VVLALDWFAGVESDAADRGLVPLGSSKLLLASPCLILLASHSIILLASPRLTSSSLIFLSSLVSLAAIAPADALPAGQSPSLVDGIVLDEAVEATYNRGAGAASEPGDLGEEREEEEETGGWAGFASLPSSPKFNRAARYTSVL
jgi:hypothetical protein